MALGHDPQQPRFRLEPGLENHVLFPAFHAGLVKTAVLFLLFVAPLRVPRGVLLHHDIGPHHAWESGRGLTLVPLAAAPAGRGFGRFEGLVDGKIVPGWWLGEGDTLIPENLAMRALKPGQTPVHLPKPELFAPPNPRALNLLFLIALREPCKSVIRGRGQNEVFLEPRVLREQRNCVEAV